MATRFSIDGEKYEFDMGSLMRTEINAMRKVTGLSGLAEWGKKLEEGDQDAMDAMIWIAVRRVHPDLTFSGLEYNIKEFSESLAQDEEPDAESDPTASPETTDPT